MGCSATAKKKKKKKSSGECLMKNLPWLLHSILLMGVEELKESMQSTIVTCPLHCALYKSEN